jgi:hypothetical protein
MQIEKQPAYFRGITIAPWVFRTLERMTAMVI